MFQFNNDIFRFHLLENTKLFFSFNLSFLAKPWSSVFIAWLHSSQKSSANILEKSELNVKHVPTSSQRFSKMRRKLFSLKLILIKRFLNEHAAFTFRELTKRRLQTYFRNFDILDWQSADSSFSDSVKTLFIYFWKKELQKIC